MRAAPLALAALAALLPACKRAPARRDDASVPAPPADTASPVDAGVWAELARLPQVAPDRVVALPTRADVPRFTLGGPELLGDLALVASSQFGFAAVDFRRGQLAWTRPAGSHVAPPIAVDGNAVLIGDCVTPPVVSARELLLGCLRVVTPAGADQAYLAIRGQGVDEFARATGDQRVWSAGGAVMWRRGDAAVAVDLVTGVARSSTADEPPLEITLRDRHWSVRQRQDGVIEATGNRPWRTDDSHGPLLGAVYLPEQSPMIRVASPTMHGGAPEILIRDIDATGSLNGQVSLSPVPGIGLLGHAVNRVGDTAIAVRLDRSLRRDFVAGYAANALLVWVYPLPSLLRPDPVGVAMAHDAVVVFHDGDTLTVLPGPSAPPAAPGAVRAPADDAPP